MVEATTQESRGGPPATSDEQVRHQKRPKKKLNAETTYEQLIEGWTQCCYLMPQKRRLCNVARSPDSMFCGNHRPASEGSGNRVTKKSLNKKVKIERIPCPVDPSHTIYRHNLGVHVNICNIRARQRAMNSEAYFCENCNSGCNDIAISSQVEKAVDPSILFDKIKSCFQHIVAPQMICDASALRAASAALSDIAAAAIPLDVIPRDDAAEPSLLALDQKIVEVVAGGQTAFNRVRHAQQDANIVRQMIYHGLIKWSNGVESEQVRRDADTAYVELGAGKGLLGLAVSTASPDASIVLVERAGQRRKVDRTLRDSERNFYRARMDIRHCYVPNLPGVVAAAGGEINNKASADAYVGELLCRPTAAPANARSQGRGGGGGGSSAKDDVAISVSATTTTEARNTGDEERSKLKSSETVVTSSAAAPLPVSASAISVKEEEIVTTDINAGASFRDDGKKTESSDTGASSNSTTGGTTTSISSNSRGGGGRKVVIIAKHLCGVATDMALRSLSTFMKYNEEDEEGDNDNGGKKKELDQQGAVSGSQSSTTPATTVATTDGDGDNDHDDGSGEGVGGGNSSRKNNSEKEEGHEERTEEGGRGARGVLDEAVRGVSIATCCHHACAWKDYAGASWLVRQGFTPEEFDVLRLWSGWAHTLRTCESRRRAGPSSAPYDNNGDADGDADAVDGSGDVDHAAKRSRHENDDSNAATTDTTGTIATDANTAIPTAIADAAIGAHSNGKNDDENEEEDEHGNPFKSFAETEGNRAAGDDGNIYSNTTDTNKIRSVIRPENITYQDMAAVGLMSKRVLDQGRVEYLRELGMNARQLQYCDPELSPECMLILATRD